MISPVFAFYGRFSTDRQNELSIDDQFRLCMRHSDREGWKLFKRFEDKALSASSMFKRKGLLALMDGAQNGDFNMVIAESLDRISRDQEDIAAIYKRLTYYGIRMFTLSEGEVNELHVGLKGTMSALFLKDLSDKTRRGVRGRVISGSSGGSLCYGYRVVRTLDGPNGQLEIDFFQASIVRRIFDYYAGGLSPVRIAHLLNSELIPGPRGGKWRTTTIIGQKARGTGILRNALYNGERIWGRSTMVRNPDTGNRLARPTSEESIERVPVPDLRIVTPDQWLDVQSRLNERTHVSYRKKVRPKLLLSGLLRCGTCGGPLTVQNRLTYGCSDHKEKGTCPNRRRITAAEAEARVLNSLTEHLSDPGLIALYTKEYRRCWAERAITSKSNMSRLEAMVIELNGQIDRLTSKIKSGKAEGAAEEIILEELKTLGEQRKTANKELAADRAGPEESLLSPGDMAERLREQLGALRLNLQGTSPAATAAREAIRSLITEIKVTPIEVEQPDRRGSGPCAMTVRGQIASLLAMAAERHSRRVMVGAGTGFEPVTFRL